MDLLNEAKSRLKDAFGDRLHAVILFGSRARGTFNADSDVDLLIVLAGDVDYWRDMATAVDAVYSLTLDSGLAIHVVPVAEAAAARGAAGLYRNALREGVRL